MRPSGPNPASISRSSTMHDVAITQTDTGTSGWAFMATAKDAVRCYLGNIVAVDGDSVSHAIDLRNATGRPARCRPHLKRLELFTGGKPFGGDLALGEGLRAFCLL